ncbi:MAG TPA: archease [Vicinamibacteria bacterium]|nr:archease [Vicinamibacteria bacterium]
MGQTPEAEWEHFAHDADIGVRGRGKTPAEAFAAVALALTAVVADPGSVRPERGVEIACAASDLEALLFDWLNAVIYEMDTQGLLFRRFEVAIKGGRLLATCFGERVEPARHQPAVEVKGATYTALHVAQDERGRWVAECVVDV